MTIKIIVIIVLFTFIYRFRVAMILLFRVNVDPIIIVITSDFVKALIIELIAKRIVKTFFVSQFIEAVLIVSPLVFFDLFL